jgi:DNA polymerase/3'-5' exonuclease PolX
MPLALAPVLRKCPITRDDVWITPSNKRIGGAELVQAHKNACGGLAEDYVAQLPLECVVFDKDQIQVSATVRTFTLNGLSVMSKPDDSWRGPIALQAGDVLSFGNSLDFTVVETTNSSRTEIELENKQQAFVQREKELMQKKQFRLYFVPKGSDMSRDILEGSDALGEGLKERARKRGAHVLDQWDRTMPPNYLIVSNYKVSVLSIVTALGFDSQDELELFLGEHAICCVKRSWVSWGGSGKDMYPPFMKPDFKHVYVEIKPRRAIVIAEYGPAKRQRVDDRADRQRFPINEELSDIFLQISKIYQKGQLDNDEDWKSYTFHKIAGRIRRMPFEITDEPEIWKRLAKTKGLGDSSIDVIRDYIENGGSSRLNNLQACPKRRAVMQFMGIFDVGRVTARQLVAKGYNSIEELRTAVFVNNTEKLLRNQLVGLKCYADFRQEMTRAEAEKILEIVSDTVHERLPTAGLALMGSYRRGRATCGDTDILITCRDYGDHVPEGLLGRFVDKLREKGHIAFHLTFIPGMKADQFETLPPEDATYLADPNHYGRSVEKTGRTKESQSYMGVFLSPNCQGMRRRIDIKFYPNTMKIFAMLYFTGNGFFNRSMRQWAQQKKGWLLSDHGLFEGDTTTRVVDGEEAFDPQHEIDVFNKLDLIWREPDERDSFDAVKGKDGSLVDTDMSKGDLRRENDSHAWVE